MNIKLDEEGGGRRMGRRKPHSRRGRAGGGSLRLYRPSWWGRWGREWHHRHLIVEDRQLAVLLISHVAMTTVDATYKYRLLQWRRHIVPECNLVIGDYKLKVRG